MSDWFVSSYSSDRQTCVEVRFAADRVHLRDSKYDGPAHTRPVLNWPLDEWRAFTAALRTGEFTR